MTLKENNKKSKRKGQYIRCPYCNFKNFVDELKELGYIEKYKGVTVITCMECNEDFQE